MRPLCQMLCAKGYQMNILNEMTNQLSPLSARHNSFKAIFNTFQENINHLRTDRFPVKGISVERSSDEKTVISFIGRTYEATFSSKIVKKSLVGVITFARILSDDKNTEIANITYNGQSVVDIQPPSGEDPVALNEDSCCLNLVLNWLSIDIYA